MLAVGLKGTAGRRAPEIGEHGAALGQPRLFFVVFGHFTANLVEKLGQTVERRLMQRHFLAENRRKGLLGQIVEGRPEAAGGDDDVRAVACGFDYVAQTGRVVTDDRLVKYVDAQFGKTLRDKLRIGVYDVAEQDLRSDCDKFCVHCNFSFVGIGRAAAARPRPPCGREGVIRFGFLGNQIGI